MSETTPSIQHEALVRVFRDRPGLAMAILRSMAEQGHADSAWLDEARVTTSVSTAPGASRFEMDLVVVLEDGGDRSEAVLLEVQRAPDPDKHRKWPLAIVSTGDELGCPTALLVITTTDRASQWARRPIETGHPGFRLRPLVLGPGNTGTDAEPGVGAECETELAALRGLIHARRPAERSWNVVYAAMQELGRLEGERAMGYASLVMSALPAARLERLEAQMTDKQHREIPMSGLERRLRERGSMDGQRELLLRLLRTRFGELDDELIARVEAGSKEQIERWAERVLDAETPEDVLA